MNTATVSSWTDLFEAEGLPRPPVPDGLQHALRPVGEATFATPGCPADMASALARWIAEPAVPRAWVGFAGHGLRSAAVRVMLCTPQIGVFVQRRYGEAYGEGPYCRRRIEGAFELLTRAFDTVQRVGAAQRWPQGLRMLLVDDDFDRLRWGWLRSGEAEPKLLADPLAYLAVLRNLSQLEAPRP